MMSEDVSCRPKCSVYVRVLESARKRSSGSQYELPGGGHRRKGVEHSKVSLTCPQFDDETHTTVTTKTRSELLFFGEEKDCMPASLVGRSAPLRSLCSNTSPSKVWNSRNIDARLASAQSVGLNLADCPKANYAMRLNAQAFTMTLTRTKVQFCHRGPSYLMGDPSRLLSSSLSKCRQTVTKATLL